MKTPVCRIPILTIGLLFILLSSCTETRNRYILYNTDTRQGVELYKSKNIESSQPAVVVDAKTGVDFYDRNVAEGVAKIGLPDGSGIKKAENAYYVDQDYVFKKAEKYRVKWSSSHKLYKFHLYEALPDLHLGDLIYRSIKDLQESHFHYVCSPLWTTVAMVILFLVFRVLWAFGADGKDKNRIYRILAFMAAFGLFVALFINYVVLGDGYNQMLHWDWLDAHWIAFANIGFFIINFILIICSVVACAAVVPCLGALIHNPDEDSVQYFCNLLMALCAYVGYCLAGVICDENIFLITMIVIYLISIVMVVLGVRKGDYKSFVYLLFPVFYYITSEAIVYMLGAFIYMLVAVAIVIFIGLMANARPLRLRGGRSVMTIDGEEVENIGSGGGYRDVYQSRSSGNRYGSNDGGNSAERI